MRRLILITAIGLAVTSTVMAGPFVSPRDARLQHERLQRGKAVEAITGAGHTCEHFTRRQTIGRLRDRTILEAFACTGENERYVIRVDLHGSISFISTCEDFAEATETRARCFTPYITDCLCSSRLRRRLAEFFPVLSLRQDVGSVSTPDS